MDNVRQRSKSEEPYQKQQLMRKRQDVNDSVSLISIVDNRVYDGTHPEADPFSRARIPKNNTPPKLKAGTRIRSVSNTSTRVSKLAVINKDYDKHRIIQATSTAEISSSGSSINEEGGVFAQRDVIVGINPLFDIYCNDDAIRSTTTPSDKSASTRSNNDREFNNEYKRLHPCNPAPAFVRGDDSTYATNASVTTNQNMTCWLDLFTTLCDAATPIRVRRKKTQYSFGCNGIQNIRRRNKSDSESYTMPLVQSHRRRHKSQQQDNPTFEPVSSSTVITYQTNNPNNQTTHNSIVPFAEFEPSYETAVYPIARYSARLNSQDLVERRRRSLRKFLTFQPILPEENSIPNGDSYQSRDTVNTNHSCGTETKYGKNLKC